ncbi:SRPBCC domain-containing protein [Leucobacter komagatae]|uniref:ATPase n=1 Tax=Leucobacter komagatae TaxID=55969 RepID=A0A0D0IMM9_9MICO|nr:SRPBCC domain-containing protein [Leucobacter komagatae]KIP52839.1 ATPase [Leucobacter komagatae]
MNELTELKFTVSGRISRPCAEVYEAVADPDQLSKYFATGGARGHLSTEPVVEWGFHDFPGTFPVTVVEAIPPRSITLEWQTEGAVAGGGATRVVFEFEPVVGDDTRTLVTITESSWKLTEAGAKSAFSNCEGWTGMLLALKSWLEYGVNLREGFYA